MKEIDVPIGWSRDETVHVVFVQVLHVDMDVQAPLDNVMHLNVGHSSNGIRNRRRQGMPVKMASGRAHKRVTEDECDKCKHFEVCRDRAQVSDPRGTA
jgi:hypothetical protein